MEGVWEEAELEQVRTETTERRPAAVPLLTLFPPVDQSGIQRAYSALPFRGTNRAPPSHSCHSRHPWSTRQPRSIAGWPILCVSKGWGHDDRSWRKQTAAQGIRRSDGADGIFSHPFRWCVHAIHHRDPTHPASPHGWATWLRRQFLSGSAHLPPIIETPPSLRRGWATRREPHSDSCDSCHSWSTRQPRSIARPR
jgi:hypothetical protein